MKLVYEQDEDGICDFNAWKDGKCCCWLDVDKNECHGILEKRPEDCPLKEVEG